MADTKEELKEYFEKGKKPTEAQFAELIDYYQKQLEYLYESLTEIGFKKVLMPDVHNSRDIGSDNRRPRNIYASGTLDTGKALSTYSVFRNTVALSASSGVVNFDINAGNAQRYIPSQDTRIEFPHYEPGRYHLLIYQNTTPYSIFWEEGVHVKGSVPVIANTHVVCDVLMVNDKVYVNVLDNFVRQ